MGCCKGRRTSLCCKERQAEFSTPLSEDTYLILIPNLFLAPDITAVIPHILLQVIYIKHAVKWKPEAPDNILSSAEVAPMLSEIICMSGFQSSFRYLFAHQRRPCLHCDNLTDTQTSNKKKVLSIYSLPVVLALHYLVCLPREKGGKEVWVAWLILKCYQAFLLNHHFKCKVSSQWSAILMTCSSCLAELLKCH